MGVDNCCLYIQNVNQQYTKSSAGQARVYANALSENKFSKKRNVVRVFIT